MTSAAVPAVTAGGTLTAIAQTYFNASGKSEANAGGVGADTSSSNSSGVAGASDNKGIIVTGTTTTNVYDNAHLKANAIALKGFVGSGSARMEAQHRGRRRDGCGRRCQCGSV